MIYAIDYGTSNSLIAAVSKDEVSSPLPIDEFAVDPTIFRSVLYFPHQDLCFYGQKAIDEYNKLSGEGRLIRSIKKFLPSQSFVGSYIDDRVVRIEDLIGYFLLEMRKRANEHTKQDVTRAIIGRPARFSLDPEKDRLAEYRLKKAAEIAGYTEIEFLPEPLAAAFDLKTQLQNEKVVLVVDLGGGTSDFTLIKIGPQKYKESDLLGMGGVSIAGDRVDGEIMRKEIAPFFGSEAEYRVPLGRNVLKMPSVLRDSLVSPADIVQVQRRDSYKFFQKVKDWTLSEENKNQLQRLLVLIEDQLGFLIFEEVERAKRALSLNSVVEFIFSYPEISIKKMIKQENFEQFIESLISKIIDEMNETLKTAGVNPSQVDLVYCTGGTSKLKVIQDRLIEVFGEEKLQKNNHFHSVTQGLARRGQEIFFS